MLSVMIKSRESMQNICILVRDCHTESLALSSISLTVSLISKISPCCRSYSTRDTQLKKWPGVITLIYNLAADTIFNEWILLSNLMPPKKTISRIGWIEKVKLIHAQKKVAP